MTERKVLNKYFPPDFDPAKIPRLKGMKKEKIFSIRTMAPFNMLCLTCRQYIFKAKKFNSRMEESEHTYIDLKEYRFRIRCPSCCAEIVYRTDRENNDYVIESGAKRSFEAYTTALRQAFKEEAMEKEELEKNPIKAVERSREESQNQFKMASKIQDLIEQSRNDGSREEMIDDTMAMILRDEETKREEMRKNIEEQDGKVLINDDKIEPDLESSCSKINRFVRETEAQKKKKDEIKKLLKSLRKNKSDLIDADDNNNKKIKIQSHSVNIFGLNYSDSD